jgi:hypothetical protein
MHKFIAEERAVGRRHAAVAKKLIDDVGRDLHRGHPPIEVRRAGNDLVGLVVLGRQVERIRLHPHVDVLADDNDRGVGILLLQLEGDGQDLVVDVVAVEVDREPAPGVVGGQDPQAPAAVQGHAFVELTAGA